MLHLAECTTALPSNRTRFNKAIDWINRSGALNVLICGVALEPTDGFALREAPRKLQGPLILRLNRSRVGADRVRLEAIVHNWLAAQQYSCPDVRATGIDPSVLDELDSAACRAVSGRTDGYQILSALAAIEAAGFG
jgi:hypothetical protein